jgi:hypothetical protein
MDYSIRMYLYSRPAEVAFANGGGEAEMSQFGGGSWRGWGGTKDITINITITLYLNLYGAT